MQFLYAQYFSRSIVFAIMFEVKDMAITMIGVYKAMYYAMLKWIL